MVSGEEDAAKLNPLEVLYKNSELDFAILKDSQTSDDYIGLSKVEGEILNKPTKIIGHPHGIPKSVADECKVAGMYESDYFFHDCDSLSGTSGGPVVVGSQVVGIHTNATTYNSGVLYEERKKFESVEELRSYFDCDSCEEVLGHNIALNVNTILSEIEANDLSSEVFGDCR